MSEGNSTWEKHNLVGRGRKLGPHKRLSLSYRWGKNKKEKTDQPTC